MFWGSKMAMNALHCIFHLFQRSSPLVIELPMEVVLLSSVAILPHIALNLAIVQPHD